MHISEMKVDEEESMPYGPTKFQQFAKNHGYSGRRDGMPLLFARDINFGRDTNLCKCKAVGLNRMNPNQPMSTYDMDYFYFCWKGVE